MKTVKEIRESAKLSQIQLANKAHVVPREIDDLEHGRNVPPLSHFRRISDALGVRMDEIDLGVRDRIISSHKVWYHLKVETRTDDRKYVARAKSVDFGEIIPKNVPHGVAPRLSVPMDENDPETTSVVTPVTWKWESMGATESEALQQLADRITKALDKGFDPQP